LFRHVSVQAGTIIREQSCPSLKLPIWFICARRYRRSQCYGGISACYAGVPAQQAEIILKFSEENLFDFFF